MSGRWVPVVKELGGAWWWTVSWLPPGLNQYIEQSGVDGLADTESEARQAAHQALAELQRTQPNGPDE
jgi:hypothetical protein